MKEVTLMALLSHTSCEYLICSRSEPYHTKECQLEFEVPFLYDREHIRIREIEG